jgi:valyl-tRNA synthetase
MKVPLALVGEPNGQLFQILDNAGLKNLVVKMANLENIDWTNEEPGNAVSFLIGTDKLHIILEKEIDVAEERDRIEKEIAYYEGFLKGVNTKLSNEKFVNNAPEKVVELEKKKLEDGNSKLKSLQEALQQLS